MLISLCREQVSLLNQGLDLFEPEIDISDPDLMAKIVRDGGSVCSLSPTLCLAPCVLPPPHLREPRDKPTQKKVSVIVTL